MDYIQGALSGMVGLFISHPIDTAKTCIQDNLKPPRDLRLLYKGLIPPLFGIGLEKSIVFGTYNTIKRKMNEKEIKPIITHAVAGSIAGFSASFIVTPCECIKILFQTSQKICNIKYLYRGFSATLSREIPGFAIYFSTYEKIYDPSMGLFPSFICGGISGALAWCFIYPQDLIKTRVQSNITRISYRDNINIIYRTHGIRGFYRGFHLALMRAVPLHGGTFCTFEFLKTLN